MKKKIIGLKILVIILTVLLFILGSGGIIIVLLYLKENYFIIGGIVFFIVSLVYLLGVNSNYLEFEEEVSKWEKLTFKRTIKFIVKYHFHIVDEIILYWL